MVATPTAALTGTTAGGGAADAPQVAGAPATPRARYLDEVLAVLYPEPCGIHRHRDHRGPQVAQYLVVPDARRPRLLVPLHSRRVATAAVRRFVDPPSRLGRLKRRAALAALHTGASALLLRDRIRVTGPAQDTIDAYLREAVDLPVALGIHIGGTGPSRKPVLQLLAPNGETVGFAKIGTNALTRRLVHAEIGALSALNHIGARHFAPPELIHSGHWRGHPVLVQSALPVWLPRTELAPRRLAEAMGEVAACCGITQGWLATSPYWADLTERVADLPEQRRSEVAQVRGATRALLARAGDTDLRYGAWHGDWTPWNMAARDGRLLLWDWERFASPVPLGFDALHHDLHRALRGGTDPESAVRDTVGRADALLAPFEVATGARPVTAALYLIELALRHLADRGIAPVGRPAGLHRWLLPAAVRTANEL